MKNEFSKSHIVNSYEVDCKRKLRLDHLFMLMQDVATEAATILGVGQESLNSFDIAWVLSRIQIELSKPIYENDKLVLNTWPCKPLFSFHPRCITICDESGDVILKSNTIWTLLNIKERNLANNDIFELGFPSDLESKPILPLPKKIDTTKVEYIKEYSPKYSDIDSNNHVNNTKYITWIMDLLPLDEVNSFDIKSVTTNYIQEVVYGDIINLGYIKEENSYTCAVKRTEEFCFSAKIEIERR